MSQLPAPASDQPLPLQVRLETHTGDVEKVVRGLGWEWCIEDTCAHYLPGEAVLLPERQAEQLLEAVNDLYALYVEAVPEDLPDDFLRGLGIPEILWRAVRQSWEDDRHWHLYGRFDLALTADGPKLIEFNADTATAIPETAVVQWASLAAAGKKVARQCSGLYEALVAQFRQWRELNPDLAPDLLLVYAGLSAEDRTNCEVLAEAAREAGFFTHLSAVEDISVSVEAGERGVWAEKMPGFWRQFPFLFKLVPWEQMAWEEPELALMLTDLLQTREVIIANPAYTLLFQSKAMLAHLWQQYPYHPLLLETKLEEDLSGQQVRKPIFGREGQNVEIVYPGGLRMGDAEGEFGEQPAVHQQYVHLPQDPEGRLYQAGVFWAGEACAIGFRRESGIITNLSQFVPHVLED